MDNISLKQLLKGYEYDKIIGWYNSKKTFNESDLKTLIQAYYYTNYLNKALQIAKQLPDNVEKQITLAKLYAHMGQLQKAQIILNGIKDRMRETNEEKIEYLFIRLIIYTNSLNQGKALNISKKLLSIIENKEKYKKFLYRLYRYLSIIYIRKFDFKKAVEYARKVVQSPDAYPEDRAFAYRYLAIIYSYKYNYYDALIYFHLSLKEFRKINSVMGILKTYTSMSFSYINMGELEIGEYFSKKAITIAEKTGDKLTLGKIYNRLGHLYVLKNELDKAEESFKIDYDYTKNLENPVLFAYSARNLGRLYKILGLNKKGEEFLNESLRIFSQTDDIINVILTKVELLDFDIKKLSYDEIEKKFLEIVKPIKRKKHFDMLANFYIKFSKIAQKYKNYKKAIEYLSLAKEELKLKDNIFHYIEVMFNLAKLNFILDNKEQALFYVKKTHNILINQHIKYLYKETIELMGKIDENLIFDATKEEIKKGNEHINITNVRKEEIQRAFKNYYIIGKSKKIQDIVKKVDKLSIVDSPILIEGETGVGKEIFAKYLYYYGNRKGRLVVINCGALPENLIESELFGYKKGAFTGANIDKLGKIKEANGGCVFFDEIDKMPLSGQASLLRLIDYNEIQPVGGNFPEKVDVRLIFASNKPLNKLIAEGKFLEDLYYRISGISIKIPPLRERKKDIPILIRYFLNIFSRKYDKNVEKIEIKALKELTSYFWPGNIRQLKNLIENIVIMNENGIITFDDIKYIFHREKHFLPLREYEKKYIEEVLKYTNNNKNKAAEILGLHRNTLLNKIKDWDKGK